MQVQPGADSQVSLDLSMAANQALHAASLLTSHLLLKYHPIDRLGSCLHRHPHLRRRRHHPPTLQANEITCAYTKV